MGIVANSNLPNLVLQLNVPQRTIFYKGVTKNIPDDYWRDEVIPKLYPLWDTDKDKLIIFTWYNNNTYHAERRKYLKNFQTNEYYWKDYEMEQMDSDEAFKLYEFLKETFYLVESLQNQEFQEELSRIYAETRSVNWLTVRLARNFLLSETDWVFLPDSGVSEETKELYITYRQKLRDLPTSVTEYAEDIKFPISPDMYLKAYILSNTGNKYLETADQWLPLASHHLTTFQEKMARYLIVKDATDSVYFSSFMNVLQNTPAVPLENVPVFNEQSNGEKLDTIIKMIEEGKLGG